MTNETKTDEKTVEAIAADRPGLFTSRLVGKPVEHQGVTFHIRPLPALVVTYIRGQASGIDGLTESGILMAMYVRYGIESIDGLTDENGKSVEITPVDVNPVRFGHKSEKLMGVPEDILTRINPDIYSLLFYEIIALTHISDADNEKLDFTTASEKPGQESDGKDAP